ncbi:MAG TPA: CdaR family protein [Candidatus Cloacimonas sp.]|nr:CdaR family protein [Candidatus Cloacimonas sp.]
MLQDNMGLKILSLLIAVFVWLQSLLISEQQSTVNLPVTLSSIPKNITLANVPKVIPFQVRGRGLEIIKLKFSHPQVLLDASKIKPGMDVISTSDYIVDLPDNIQLEILGPVEKQEITVYADVFYQKKVPVELAYADSYTREHFAALHYTLIPEQITISGSKSIVQQIDHITTEPISRSVLNKQEFTVKLNPPDNEVSILEKQVKVYLSTSFLTTKIIPDKPIMLPPGKSSIPSTVTIKLSGDSEILKNLKESEISVLVSSQPDEQGFYPVTVKTPANINIVAVTPQKVRLK